MDLKQYRSKLIGNDDERAVSPVIGVILMVAITVILAAVIAAFVLDLGQGLSSQAQASASIEGNSTNEITVTAEGMANADGIAIIDQSGNVIAGSGDFASGFSGASVDGAGNPLTNVGTSVTFSVDDGTDTSQKLNVIAYNGPDDANPDDRSGENIIGEFTIVSSA